MPLNFLMQQFEIVLASYRSERGSLRSLLDWVRATIHARGSSVSSRELIVDATGRPPMPAFFVAISSTDISGEYSEYASCTL